MDGAPVDPFSRAHRSRPAHALHRHVAAQTRARVPGLRAALRSSRSTGRRISGAPCGTSAASSASRGERVAIDLDRMPGAAVLSGCAAEFRRERAAAAGNGPALIFNGESQRHRTVSHDELRAEVARFASALRAAGIRPGDRVAGYLPNMPEAIIARSAPRRSVRCGPRARRTSASRACSIVSARSSRACSSPRTAISTPARPTTSARRSPRSLAQLPTVERVVIVPVRRATAVARRHSRRRRRGAQFIDGARRRRRRVRTLPFNHPLYILYSSGTTASRSASCTAPAAR